MLDSGLRPLPSTLADVSGRTLRALRSSFVFWLTEAVFITKRERSGVKLLALMSGGCMALCGALRPNQHTGQARQNLRALRVLRGEKIVLS